MIGERIASARTRAGLTQAQLAELVGVSQTSLSRWESGEMSLNAKRLEKLATALEVSIDWLVRGDHLPSVPTVEGAGEVRS